MPEGRGMPKNNSRLEVMLSYANLWLEKTLRVAIKEAESVKGFI
jgi:hypothetical protein